MTNSRQKGALAEKKLAELLKEYSGLDFIRTPGSGSGTLKGDLYIPSKSNIYCIEIKHYEESHFNDKILTSSSNNFIQWWTKLVKQAKQSNKKPLLFFKYNRSKWFVTTEQKPLNVEKTIDIPWLSCYTMEATEWLAKEKIDWIKNGII